jgi:hypothetical protein
MQIPADYTVGGKIYPEAEKILVLSLTISIPQIVCAVAALLFITVSPSPFFSSLFSMFISPLLSCYVILYHLYVFQSVSVSSVSFLFLLPCPKFLARRLFLYCFHTSSALSLLFYPKFYPLKQFDVMNIIVYSICYTYLHNKCISKNNWSFLCTCVRHQEFLLESILTSSSYTFHINTMFRAYSTVH